MSKYILNILLVVVTLSLASCVESDYIEPASGDGRITLQITDGGKALRATAAETQNLASERALKHMDIFVFNSAEACIHQERVSTFVPSGDNNAQTVTLGKRPSDFDEAQTYDVYVVANSTADLTGIATLGELRNRVQVDERVHVTGLGLSGAPTHFLMDGKAGGVALNQGEGVDVEINMPLQRAAAKIVVTFQRGADVVFDQNAATNYQKGYFLRNMPYSTTLLSEASTLHDAMLRTPDKVADEQFEWGADQVKVTAYVYAHNWGKDGNTFFEKGTTLVVNIPLTYNGVHYGNCYYQIPVVKPAADNSYTIHRNTYYEVKATINAPGAEDVTHPVEVQDLTFTTKPWTEVLVSVGDDATPRYLELNKEEMEMHNVDEDNTLEFTSSSEVTAEVVSVSYVDKFGQTIDITNTAHGITLTPQAGYAGNIQINSPIPTNNTIRYITIKVTNKEGNVQYVTVRQYPVIYITNQQSYYSYRDDFKSGSHAPTTIHNQGARIVGVSLTGNTNSWNYTYNTSSQGFWRSKVVDETHSNGKSDISYYSWSSGWGNSSYTLNTTNAESNSNARMYHIRVTSTSDDYVVSRPGRDANDKTLSDANNAKLVSPSFMIASRLGFVNSSSGNLDYINTEQEYIDFYGEHCKQYVEVYKDDAGNEVVLDDWRLPTESELKIIMDVQGTQNQNADAIDYLLNARYYVSASGRVQNSKNSTQGTAGRCVRDVYNKK